MMASLTPEQQAHFAEQGFLLVSGQIPASVWTKARADIEEIIAEQSGTSFFRTTAANACYNEDICAVAATLGNRDADNVSRPYFPVSGALAIITYPSAGEWTWSGPHIDHALAKDEHRVFPPPYQLASLLYLGDIGTHGGGTVVWPGSHLEIEALARSEPDRYERMATLNESLPNAALGEPVELTPRAGDILFYHYLLAHAGSKNTTTTPRIALNHKW